MPSVIIVYHSTYGHTAAQAKAELPLNEGNRIGVKFCPAFSKERLSAPR